ncbi:MULTISPECIES: SRPBCC family protein [Nocardiopsis]|uniref:Activator of Hsp90 ATPase 1 family protein n=1 Tax=Nocardiopsis dassonvillei (strain ATCC 23218 / DSM 43111 / CIP 107115 / JCM 7437 / KCTC 9190 / NBRC 14626 / NCTC 10488 / NRRL B-5397 / IMRU 509) TaxID=446468 RepID=D7B362_NOCDD|nr:MULTISPECIES: SRPBCC family protein [Nocardiopsis]ADH68752.1 Activator of Hsp90 ATPase 1 family protein [Nocardiopsis dassonvillei subsp. dassonvillei DSM 43111]APC36810.1 ATPase [Nocardiopsis dassonvillei]NKY78020.1 SRPBCC family protein [Nocardiopsis dassonvillei]VEI89261.1 Activator of Hsp90 ATPase homolog 1-like protein [Nocardiopsis dassonvillei]
MSDLTVIAEPGRHDIVVTRSFDAPRDVVFRAMTDAEHLARWWGLKENETVIDHADLRRGGSWRFVERAPDGQEYAFHGVVHDVVAPERFVQTFEFEGMPGHVCLETTTLEEGDGRTLYTSTTVFQSVEDRDGMVESGMEYGLKQSMDALDELLATMG